MISPRPAAENQIRRQCGCHWLSILGFLVLISADASVALEKVVFRVTTQLSSVVAFIADAEGYFEDEGLEVEMIIWNSGSAYIPSLAQGKIDVSTTGQFDAGYVNVIQRGARIRLVAARTIHDDDACGYFSFTARSELLDGGRLDDLTGLRGLRISTDRTSGSYYYWSLLLERAGLTFDDVELVDIPSAAKPDAYIKNLVDITTQSEPWITRIVRTGHGRVWRSVADVLPGRQSTFLVFGRRILDDRPDLGKRFLAAYMRAVAKYSIEGKSNRNIEIIAKQTKLEPDELREMCWPTLDLGGYIDDTSLQEYQQWAFEQGLIDHVVPRSQLVDDRFLPSPNADPKTASNN